MRIGRLHVITDVVVQNRFTHEELAEMACAGGADVIQLRDKVLARETFVKVARSVAAICRRHDVALIINDRVDIAGDINADGVHLGPDDMSLADARALLGPDAVIGASTGTRAAARAAEAQGADYVGHGHIFATASKTKSNPPVGLEELASVTPLLRIPVIAIGGITEANARDVIAAGAWGIAVIGAVCTADDPRAATERLRAIVYS